MDAAAAGFSDRQSIETSTRINRVILTMVHAEAMTSLNVDALIVACGGRPPVLPRAFPPTLNLEIAGPVILVDFIDDSDPIARAASLERIRAYRDNGFRLCDGAATFARHEGSAGLRTR